LRANKSVVRAFVVLVILGLALVTGGPLNAIPLPPLRRVNAPYFNGSIPFEQAAIFWLGRVSPTENYADVRVGYNNTELFVSVLIFDRLLWYDETPTAVTLTNYDAVTLYLDKNGNNGSAPGANSYRLVGQVNWWEPRADWQAAWLGNGTQWTSAAIPFTSVSDFRWESSEVGGFNNNQNNRGWLINYHIPFTSLGLSGSPAQGSIWGLGIAIHDRDTATGPMSPLKTWPENLIDAQPGTWGQLRFDLPNYVPQPAVAQGSTTVRQGMDGASVFDTAVGGTVGNMCPGDPNYIWNQWAIFSDPHNSQINVQNQGVVSEWPCFAKYFVTFPLSTVPDGKVILSATLTLHQFGNAGVGQTPPPVPSYLQVLTLGEAWDENTLTWNTAPLARENVSGAWVDPLSGYGGDPGIPRTWDVSRAVAEAYAAGEPLRLAIYSADWAYHSGRYFWSSDHEDLHSEARPTLTVAWGEAESIIHITARPNVSYIGRQVTYTLSFVGSGHVVTLTNDLPPALSAPSTINVVGGGPASYEANGHRVIWTDTPPFGQFVTMTFPVTVMVPTPIAISSRAILTDAVTGVSTDTTLVIANPLQVWLPLILR
jgi:hypothetical protein